MISNYSLADIERGYAEDKDTIICTVCETGFEKGRVYEADQKLYDASGMFKHHFLKEHGSTAAYLLKQESRLTGISDIQKEVLTLILEGKTDKEISAEIGIAQSTVRNHKFKLREKEKQAKLFLALMESINQETSSTIDKTDSGMIEAVHLGATMVDERYNITDKERQQVLAVYMEENGAVKQIPARAKKKIIILTEIMKNFKADQKYSEAEINRILKRIHAQDYVGIRRALIEYGFMDRSDDGRTYRVKA